MASDAAGQHRAEEEDVEARSLLLSDKDNRWPERGDSQLEDVERLTRHWGRRAALWTVALTLVLLVFVAPGWSALPRARDVTDSDLGSRLDKDEEGSKSSSSSLSKGGKSSVQDLFYTQKMLEDEIFPAAAPKVEFAQRGDQWQVYFNNEVYGSLDGGGIRGLAGWHYYYEAAEGGADAVRIWGVDGRTPGIIDTCRKAGLKISIGLDLPRAPMYYTGDHCIFENTTAFWSQKMASIEQNVQRFKSSPELLWWTVGNELETWISWATGSPCLWERVEWVTQRVKAIDDRHPVGTVLAGHHPSKVTLIRDLCPSLDFLGLNAYGGVAYNLGEALISEGWNKPYAITEYGVPGSWEVPQTPWGANVEPLTSTEKKRWLTQTFRWCKDAPNCVGSFAFLWGWKWEKTATWFGMYNEWWPAGGHPGHGIRNDMADDLFFEWTRKAEHHQSPRIYSVSVLAGGQYVKPELGFFAERGTLVQVDMKADNFGDIDSNEVIWVITSESYSKLNGNQVETPEAPKGKDVVTSCAYPGVPSAGLRALVDTSKLIPGAYRIYAFVRHSTPSYPPGCQTAADGDPCWGAIQWTRNTGLKEHPEWYPQLSEASADWEIQNFLFNHQNHACRAPCDEVGFAKEAQLSLPMQIFDVNNTRQPCENAVAPQECFFKVQKQLLKAQQDGVTTGPFSGTLPNGPFSHFQSLMARNKLGCSVPCPVTLFTADSGQCDSSDSPSLMWRK